MRRNFTIGWYVSSRIRSRLRAFSRCSSKAKRYNWSGGQCRLINAKWQTIRHLLRRSPHLRKRPKSNVKLPAGSPAQDVKSSRTSDQRARIEPKINIGIAMTIAPITMTATTRRFLKAASNLIFILLPVQPAEMLSRHADATRVGSAKRRAGDRAGATRCGCTRRGEPY